LMASVGKGTYTWSNGNKYVGEWKGWLQHGQGTLTWSNGYRFKGEWKEQYTTKKETSIQNM